MRRVLEWSVFLFICCVLVAIAIPNNVNGHNRPKISSVKANMHTLQTIVETYAVDWKGVYPDNVDALKKEATKQEKNYWKELKNPYSSAIGRGVEGAYNDLSDNDITSIAMDATTTHKTMGEGVVGYKAIYIDGKAISYAIYGSGKGGKPATDKGNNIFFLSNQ